ncbi:MAG: hypothetical protein JSS97_10685 [Actinobacteria bacterium]|nr:hypothetical protein [Actinomycetota bacterium]
MNDQRSANRGYPAVLMAFLIGLVTLGLLGVPALLVAAIGIAVAALAIAASHRFLEAKAGAAPRRRISRARVPERYVPSVLEGSSMRRRRTGLLRRHRHPSPPFRFH